MIDPSLALQTAIRSRLIADPAVTAVVPASHIFDRARRPEAFPCVMLVVNARATKANLGLLHALKSGKLPAFATGGVVGSSTAAPSLGSGSSGSAAPIHISHTTHVNASGGTAEQNHDLARKVARETEAAMRRLVISEVQQQRRPGGAFEA